MAIKAPVMEFTNNINSLCESCKLRFECCTSKSVLIEAYSFDIDFQSIPNSYVVVDATFNISDMMCLDNKDPRCVRENCKFKLEDSEIHPTKFRLRQEERTIISIEGAVY